MVAGGIARWLLIGLMGLLGLVASWDIVCRAAAHYFARNDPAAALAWSPGDPEALAMLSDDRLVGRGTAKNLASAEILARQALAAAPLQAGALRNLGLVADARGQTGKASEVMDRARRRGFRDIATQAWLLQRALGRSEFDDAFLRLDAILRTKPDLSGRLFPALAAISTAPGSIDPLARRLATRPAWRTAALLYLADETSSLTAITGLTEGLVRLRSPPSEQEEAGLLSRMVKEGRYQEARRVWASLLPAGSRADGALVYDGAFRGLAGAAPFNWRLFPSAGLSVETAKSSASRKSGLFVDYPVRDPATLADQLLVLPPGTYRLTARFQITGAAAGASLGWTVRCAAGDAVLGETRQKADVATPWTALATTFTVPPDCPAQWLRLGGRAGDGFGDLSALYDDVAVTAA